ncbi:hypothetical protein C1H46_021702 [Malus baccata]|uniref:Uncharacterized protein n=1 Tax=Malus baccata TaxID=106549 RepID=A0A540M2E6_MALBA|nr:hypothetical protein C1H46_021702 [Malus baccata]
MNSPHDTDGHRTHSAFTAAGQDVKGHTLDDHFLDDDTMSISSVVASARNDGLAYETLLNGAPWAAIVGVGMTDCEFWGILTFPLGNGVQITFTTLYARNSSRSKLSIVFAHGCQSVMELKKLKNKIVVCKDNLSISDEVENVTLQKSQELSSLQISPCQITTLKARFQQHL